MRVFSQINLVPDGNFEEHVPGRTGYPQNPASGGSVTSISQFLGDPDPNNPMPNYTYTGAWLSESRGGSESSYNCGVAYYSYITPQTGPFTSVEHNTSRPFWLDIPNSYFGQQHPTPVAIGEENLGYGVIYDFKRAYFNTRFGPKVSLYVKLIQKIPPHSLVNLSFDAVYKRRPADPVNGDFTQSTETPDSTKINVKLGDDDKWSSNPSLTYSLTITENGGSANNQWQRMNLTLYSGDYCCEYLFFQVDQDEDYDWRAVFIDNVELTFPCQETYHCDPYNIPIDGTLVVANSIHQQNQPLTIQGTHQFLSATLQIYQDNLMGNELVYTEYIQKPNDEIYWSGLMNQNGHTGEAPPGSYKWKLFPSYSTSCFCPPDHFEGQFTKQGIYGFNLGVNGFSSSITPLTIYGLEPIHQFYFVISDMSGQTVYQSPVVFYPPDVVSWNGLTTGGNALANGTYKIALHCSNNCAERIYNYDFQYFDQGPVTHTNYLSNSIFPPKPDSECLSVVNYWPVAQPPKPCCISESELNYSGYYFSGDDFFMSYGTISVGTDCVILPGSNIHFWARESITLDPGFESTYNGLFETTIADCAGQRIETNDISDLPSEEMFIKPQVELSPKPQHDEKFVSLLPNPVKDVLTVQYAGYETCRISISDVAGKVLFTQYSEAVGSDIHQFQIQFSAYAEGVYFISCELNNHEQKFFKVLKH